MQTEVDSYLDRSWTPNVPFLDMMRQVEKVQIR